MRAVVACVLSLLVFGEVWSQDGWRKRVEVAYRRSALAAEIMYIDGLLANRDTSYVILNENGLKLDLSVERQRFQEIFSQGTRVRFATKILKIEEGSDFADCLVDQVLKVERIDPRTGERYTDQVLTRAIDHWASRGKRPRLMWTRLVQQRFAKGPPLEEDHVWPILKPKPVAAKKPKAK